MATRNQTAKEEFEAKLNAMAEKYSGRFIKLHTPDLDISSNQIREWVAQNKSIRYYVPEAVRSYIEKQKMYKDCE